MVILQATFIQTVGQLRARRNLKWSSYPEDVLPAWLAEMDFSVAPAIREAAERLVTSQDFGYRTFTGAPGVPEAWAQRMQARYGWTVDPARTVAVADVVQGMHATVFALSEPGDGVVVLTPIFPPFRDLVRVLGRSLVECPLHDDGTRFVLDPDTLRRAIDSRARILLLCSPHNPTGRVFSRAELQALADIALERDLTIVSDEIYADVVYPGAQHLPIATLAPEVAARTVTLASATKAFNIAGVRCGLLHFGSAELQQRLLQRLPEGLLGPVSTLGMDATTAAWSAGDAWLAAVLAYLQGNRDELARRLRSDLPGVRAYPPESTYLAWLDCRDLGLPVAPAQFFLDEARVALRGGSDFGAGAELGVRLTFATSAEILDQMLDRMASAIKRHA